MAKKQRVLVAINRWLKRPVHPYYEKLCRVWRNVPADIVVFEHGGPRRLGRCTPRNARVVRLGAVPLWAEQVARTARIYAARHRYEAWGLLDDDVYVQLRCIEVVVAAFERWPRVAQVSLAGMYESMRMPDACRAVKGPAVALWNEPPWAGAACKFYRTKAATQCKLFEFGTPVWEDVAAALRLHVCGWNLAMAFKVGFQHRRSYWRAASSATPSTREAAHHRARLKLGHDRLVSKFPMYSAVWDRMFNRDLKRFPV